MGSVELDDFPEEEESLQETVPQGRRKWQGRLLFGSLWVVRREGRVAGGGSGERCMNFPAGPVGIQTSPSMILQYALCGPRGPPLTADFHPSP